MFQIIFIASGGSFKRFDRASCTEIVIRFNRLRLDLEVPADGLLEKFSFNSVVSHAWPLYSSW
jgi:hypothetical protein